MKFNIHALEEKSKKNFVHCTTNFFLMENHLITAVAYLGSIGMDPGMDKLQKSLIEIEIEAEKLLLARHQV